MVPSLWRFSSFLLVAIVLTQNIYLWHAAHTSLEKPNGSPLSLEDSPPSKPQPAGRWTFNASSDGNNHALTKAQCDSAFPDLYYEIDRAAKLRKDREIPISREDVSIGWRNDAAFRGLIHENQLRILQTKGAVGNLGYRRRTLSLLSQINRAIAGATAAGQKLPSIEFAVTVDDMAMIPNKNDTHAIWSFARRLIDGDQERQWLVPDFDFWSWGQSGGASYSEMRTRATDRDSFLADKIPQAVWRGVVWTNEGVRGPLIAQTKDQTWADVEEVSWDAGAKDNMIPIEDYCRYAFIVHTEGRSWSGRLKFILNCDSVPVVHKLDWAAWYYHLLVPDGPGQNYIPVKRDHSNLGKKIKQYMRSAELTEAQIVADNAVKTFRDRYLTPAAEACYWRRLIDTWSEVSFKPEVWQEISVNVSGAPTMETRLRGVAFEEFIQDPREVD
ncbi:hypothetical protein Q7P37_007813 [Cladosporium fusiforme]